MQGVPMMPTEASPDSPRYLIDPYEDWAAAEPVPVIEGYGVDLLTAETRPWPRFGLDGAIVHLKARADFTTLFLYRLPPGGSSMPVRHLYEQLVYVLEGHGSTQIEGPDGKTRSFEWGPKSLFALPLNARYRLFNGSGRERALLACCNCFPLVYNLFMNEDVIFNCANSFPERLGPDGYFDGEGRELDFGRGSCVWETNFVSDISAFALKPQDDRGPGSTYVQFILGNGVMKAHVSAMPVGTYKKAHRHGPDFFLFNVTGTGYSLMWYEGESDFLRTDWRHGVVFSPPDMMYHQHFNTGAESARYLAMNLGNRRYPFTGERKKQAKALGVSVKDGGRQIEYEDQDPRIHRLYLDELARHGAPCLMSRFMDESVLLRRMNETV
jgi:mannose-6-phosphate isomerase-like protein (cupin superfamily)